MTDPRIAIIQKWEHTLDPYDYAGPEKCAELLSLLTSALPPAQDVVERVARALHEHTDGELGITPDPFESLLPNDRAFRLRQARAAIQAMGEATRPLKADEVAAWINGDTARAKWVAELSAVRKEATRTGSPWLDRAFVWAGITSTIRDLLTHVTAEKLGRFDSPLAAAWPIIVEALHSGTRTGEALGRKG